MPSNIRPCDLEARQRATLRVAILRRPEPAVLRDPWSVSETQMTLQAKSLSTSGIALGFAGEKH